MGDHANAGTDEDVWTPVSLRHCLCAATDRLHHCSTFSSWYDKRQQQQTQFLRHNLLHCIWAKCTVIYAYI